MVAFLESIWWYLIFIGATILLHELGHYCAARFFDVKVERFSFGFGPRLFGFRGRDTDFCFSAIPFGGYVKMAADEQSMSPTDGTEADPRWLKSKPRWQRAIIAFAGPAVNLVLAVGLLTGLFMFEFPKRPEPQDPVVGWITADGAAAKAGLRIGDRIMQVDDMTDPTAEDIHLHELAAAGRPEDVWVMRDGRRLHLTLTPVYDAKQEISYSGWAAASDVRVQSVVPDLGADHAGLKVGDTLVSVNGQKLYSAEQLNEAVAHAAGQPVNLIYMRGGQQHEVAVAGARVPDGNGQERWMIGVLLEPGYQIVKLPLGEAFVESCRWNLKNTKLIYQVLEGIVERRMSPRQIDGPIRVAQFTGEAAKRGPADVAVLVAAVSLNLAIVNMLPVPILDGGVILMLLVEMLMRRDLDMRVKEAVVKVGLVFLMVVVVFVIYNDISKMLPPG